jgi:hypothetical protein
MVVKPKGNLRALVRKFYDGCGNSYKNGDWQIGSGGYDCWFDIYLNGVEFIRCMDSNEGPYAMNGRLEGSFTPLYNLGMNDKEAEEFLEKCFKDVTECYPRTHYIKDDRLIHHNSN